ncbi:trypco2 family protein [Actinacidiphila glaucinigra]|uniref:trypco2 family protein n=1 Tax=Actinacidiphila glaucinigra TaxID=235986 RepID=UPI000B7919DC|nr:trypco2 family protein [Actinacidiphila glaucinigra]
MAPEPWTGLSQAISAIRDELEQAMADGQDHTVQFRVGPVEVEFAVDVKKDGEARAKVMVLPWSAEVKTRYDKATAHRLKITLQPVDGQGADQKISDRSAERPE